MERVKGLGLRDRQKSSHREGAKVAKEFLKENDELCDFLALVAPWRFQGFGQIRVPSA